MNEPIRVCVECESERVTFLGAINVNDHNDYEPLEDIGTFSYWCADCDGNVELKEQEKAMDNEERKLKGLALAMDMALDKVSRKERWAKPIKTPKHIAQKLADAREQRKKDKETS